MFFGLKERGLDQSQVLRPMIRGTESRFKIRRVRMACGSLLALAFVTAILLLPATAGAQNLSQCRWDLDKLAREARQASSEAASAATAESSLENALSDLKRCVDFPEIHDLLRDGCRAKQRKAKAVAQDLESELNALSNALAAVGTAIRSVNLSCGQGYGTSHLPSGNIPPTGGGAPTVPSSLSKKELGALIAVGAIGVLIASGYGQEKEPNRLDFSDDPQLPSTKTSSRTEVSVVTERITISDSLTTGVPPLTTVRRLALGDQRIGRLAELADTSTDSVDGFRWGKSAAPKESELFGSTWYTILLVDGGAITLFAQPDGRVTHRRSR